jgi:hypothetical protein
VSTEVQTRSGWRRLGQGAVAAPQIDELDRVSFRGAPAGVLRLGGVDLPVATSGDATLRLTDHPELNGHLGLMEVTDGSGAALGEIEVVPSKLSLVAYQALRADLVRVWGDLVFEPDGVSAVSARPPSAADLLARIERPLAQIIDQPAERLVASTGVRRLDRVRHSHELSPALVLAGRRGLPARTRVLERSIDTPERQMVVTTLHMLRQHARRDIHGAPVAARVDRILAEHFRDARRLPVRSFTWGMRADQRYRQILAVHQILDRLHLHATEGPGELRLGVRGMIRLYEYWVYLQVLLAARERYGPPLAPGFDVLAVDQRGTQRRLELAAGTTVSFAGGVHVAFEPVIKANGAGWMNIEYVPHPDSTRQSQLTATPDVAVLCDDEHPRLIIVDAKYVGRGYVERAASTLHEKYARMRLRGRPIVERIYAAHPHIGFATTWAGYGHFGLAPGHPTSIPLPIVGRRSFDVHTPTAAVPDEHDDHDDHDDHDAHDAHDAPRDLVEETVSIVVDQYWMLRHLGGRRIALAALRDVLAGDRAVVSCEIVMPDIAQLHGFAAAARRDGWSVHWTSSVERAAQIEELIELVEYRLDDGRVIVVSGDGAVVERLPGHLVELCTELSMVPSLG